MTYIKNIATEIEDFKFSISKIVIIYRSNNLKFYFRFYLATISHNA